MSAVTALKTAASESKRLIVSAVRREGVEQAGSAALRSGGRSAVQAAERAAVQGGEEIAEQAARGGVYTLKNAAGEVVRTGRTGNLIDRRAAHASDPVLGKFGFEAVYRTDVYAVQRGLEQLLYDRFPGAQVANGGYNGVRGISLSNPRGPAYMQAAMDFLLRLGAG